MHPSYPEIQIFLYRLTFANAPIVFGICETGLIGNNATIIAAKETREARTTNIKFVEYCI